MNWFISVKNEMPACPYLSISRYKNWNHTSHFSWTSFNVFNIKEFKLNILTTTIFSGATEWRKKIEMLEMWNQRENEKQLFISMFLHTF